MKIQTIGTKSKHHRQQHIRQRDISQNNKMTQRKHIHFAIQQPKHPKKERGKIERIQSVFQFVKTIHIIFCGFFGVLKGF